MTTPTPEDESTGPAGPFTHTFGPRSLSVGGYKRVGRWPGIANLWDKLMEHHGHRLRPPWEWFLYGKRIYVQTDYPSVTFSNQETSIGADGTVVASFEFTADDALGRLYKSMFEAKPTEASE